ncbi:MAG TPA: DUF4265 domain-containing protein [Gemmatimonadaceae bacterium]|nr:DUF4265 domain-containing protein [Gemmatimonadaceae bacterium]
MAKTQHLEKIVLLLPPGDWHGYVTETVWAEKVSDGLYRIRSVPFYAKGVSFGDVVTTKQEDGRPMMAGISLRSGHSTYRAFIKAPAELGSPEFNRAWNPIEQQGCTYERATEHLIAIDVPHSANLATVYALLEDGESAGVWDFEEAYAAED